MTAPPQDPIAPIRALWAAGAFPDILRVAAAQPDLLRSDEAAFAVAHAHIYTGALAEAEPILKAILARTPALTEARAALCKLYVVQGRAAEAEPLFQLLQADAQRDPRAARLLGEAYMQARRIAEAHAAFTAYKRATGDPAADINLAETLIRMGRAEEGVLAARAALAALGWSPRLLPVLGPAALCAGDEPLIARCFDALDAMPAQQSSALLQGWIDMLIAGDRLSEAERASAKLVALAPTPARARLHADLLLSNHDAAGAIDTLRQALDAAPQDASLHAMLGRCFIVSGDLAVAKDAFRAALAADPDNISALENLAQIEPFAFDDAMRVRLNALRTAPPRDPEDQARAALALGRVAEAEGRYAEAFDLYAEGKADIARRAALAGRGYEHANTATHVRNLIQGFAAPIAFAGADRARPRPIFIVGMPRSGTTLTEAVLGAHPEIAAAGELPGMMRVFADFLFRSNTEPDAARNIAAKGADWIAAYRAGLPAAASGKAAFTDKHPLNFMSVGIIKALFPDARIVHVSRNPADTALSIFKERFYVGYNFANNLDAIAHYYAAYEKLMAHWTTLYPDDIFEACYEDFVVDLEGRARALIAFCGLPWNDACLDFHKAERAIFTHSAAQVRKPVSTASVSRAQRFGDKLRPFEDALARYRQSL